MFLTFLGLSLFFWFLSKLSKEYTHEVSFKTNYINLTKNKMLQHKHLNQLQLTLKTTGFKFLSYKFNKPSINIDLSSLNKLKSEKYFLLTDTQLSDFQSQVKSEVTINFVKPDTLFFDVDALKEKQVRVKSLLKLNFRKGYNIANKIKIVPEFIEIIGPENKIDSILQIETEVMELKDVYKNINKGIKLTQIPNVKYSIDKIKVTATVEKFTEGKKTLTFELINVVDSLNVTTFVKKIDITYKVSLENFNKVQDSDFKIICDFEKSRKEHLNYLIPIFVKQSPLVTDLKINPTKIEYLIKK